MVDVDSGTQSGSLHQQALLCPRSNPRATSGPAAPKRPLMGASSATLVMLRPLLTIRPLPSPTVSRLPMPTITVLAQDSFNSYPPLFSPTAEV